MKLGIKLTALLLLLVSLSIPSLTSCNRSYDEEEVIDAAGELLARAEVLNEIYYGRGINYISSGYVDGNYYEADPMHLSLLGFSTIEELKGLTLKTFTLGYSDEIFATKLSMIEDETGIQYMTRYYQRYDGLEHTEPVCIMVYSKAKPQLTSDIEYDYSSLRIKGVKRQTVTVIVSACVTGAENKSMTVDIELDLIEEDNGWRIDNPCYANYNELADKYGELDG